MIKVSVIVPVFNVENYIKKCLDSLVNQTLEEIEIIIVNDGSKDDSEKIILEYIKRYPDKIKYLKKQNGGLSDARNYGTRYAKGEYIAYLDSDDYIDKSTYELMYKGTSNGKKKIVECNFFWTFENKEKIDKVDKYSSLEDYLVNGRVVAWNKLYKRKWIEDTGVIFPKGLLYEDLEFFLKIVPLLDTIDDIAVVSLPLIHYVQRSTAISYKETDRVKHITYIYDNVINYYKKNDFYEKYKSELEYKYCRNLLGSFLKKVLKIKDRHVKYELLDLFWKEINEKFSDWKKNKYINENKSLVNLYMKCMNKFIYKLFYIL